MTLSFTEYKNLIDLTPYPRPEPMGSEREKVSACDHILKFLLRERGLIAAFSADYHKKRELIRNYANMRAALPVPQEMLELQDRLFWTESMERGVVDTIGLQGNKYGLCLWEGDITRLNADAIVNAANKSLLGCFVPKHFCIDNVIHSYAGMQLRDDCAKLIAAQGGAEACGEAKVTRAYNLPAKYVIHTVGPMIGREVTEENRAELRSCYTSCLDLANEIGLNSIAFCCISTGVFNFPRAEAAEIATGTVLNWRLRHPESSLQIIFDTYLKEDTEIYQNILRMM